MVVPMAGAGETAAGVQRQMKVIFGERRDQLYTEYIPKAILAPVGPVHSGKPKKRAAPVPHPCVDSRDRRSRRCTRGSPKQWTTWRKSDGSSFRASRASTAAGFAGELIPTDGRWPRFSSTYGWWKL